MNISDLICSPHIEELKNANASGRAGSMICGAFLVMSLEIDGSKNIDAARFKAAGCSRLLSACATITEAIEGLSTAEAAARVRNISHREFELLGEPAEGREHCVALACGATLAAISNYSDSARQEWIGDDALICSCFGVSEQTIEIAIRRQGLRTIEAVTSVCKAGGGCRSCYPLIQDILGEVNGE